MPEPLDDAGLARLRGRVAQGSLRLAGADFDAGLWLVPDMTALLARLDAAEAGRDALRAALESYALSHTAGLPGSACPQHGCRCRLCLAARVAARGELPPRRAGEGTP